MSAELAFPAPEPSDTEDVAWTLQTAGTMWARGDVHEAVRWLRRAAEAAGDSGNDERALKLARAAADLTQATNLPPSVPPPPVAAAPTPPPLPAPPANPDQTSRMAVPPLSQTDNPITPFDDPDGAEGDYTIPEGLEAVEPPPRRPPPPPRSSPAAAPSSTRNSPSSAPASSRGFREPPPARPSTLPGRVNMRPRQALRVAITPHDSDKNLLIARVLADDEPTPEGEHEALLTAIEAGAHLLAKKR
jgi:hypothetical protein